MAPYRKGQNVRNRMLLALPREVRDQLLRHCHFVDFPYGHVIYSAGDPIEQVYFVESGLVSLIRTMKDGRSAEICAVGIEGVTGLLAAYGFDRALAEYVVQVPLVALRINRKTLRHQISVKHALRGLVA